ncbi:ComEC/Rec2 family competence protein [Nonomuraea harbinensis]|uniref:ComEC/Rec2 family competence protein n=1 Tax=Nonomuraea harbinensis TaxID=1286938 RepID=A0ABW1BVK6_9ACTN|nr:ComEC/Rec2 family competence protein [Nonomuraea harbinensis]
MIPAAAAWTTALVLLGCPVQVAILTCLLAAAGSPVAWRFARGTARRNTMVAVLISVAATSGSIALRLHAVTTGPVAELAAEGASITAEITLTDDPKVRRPKPGLFQRDSIVVEANLEILRTGTRRISVHSPIVVFANGAEWRPLLPSQRLHVRGRLAEPTSPGLVAAILLVRDPPEILTPPSPVHTVAGEFRSGLREAAGVLPPDQRGLLPALVVGDVSRLDPQVDEDLREAGLSHLNAVSGANLAIVASAALALCRLAGLPLAPRAAFAALAMIAFAIVARPSPSVLRALLMGLVAALALGTGRAKDGVAALSAAVLLLILFVPDLARSYGFALSVTATAGILLLAPRWRTRLTGDPTAHPPPTAPGSAAHAPVARPVSGSGRKACPASEPEDSTRLAHPGAGLGREARSWDFLATASSGSGVGGGESARVRLEGFASGARPGSGVGGEAGEFSAAASRGPGLRGFEPGAGSGFGVGGATGAVGLARPGDSCPRSVVERRAVGRRRVRWPRWAAEAVVVTAAAQAAVTPVLVLMSGQISLVAVPANLLAGPAVAPATLLGFVAALIAPFWPEAAQALVVPAGYAVGWIIVVSRWAVGIPLASVPWPQGIAGLGLLAVAAAVAVVLLRRRAGRAVILAVAAGVLIAVLVIRPIAAPWPPRGWLMVMCDVGQGDGLVIAAGPGQGVVVDAGPDPAVMDRCLRRLGVRDVPLVILTHPHGDHVNGLAGVQRDRRVGAVITSPHRASAPQSARLSAGLARRRIPEHTAQPGTRWRLGPSELTVLAPESAAADGPGEGSAANNASIVLHVRWRAGSALLSGDIESEAQHRLLRDSLPRADIFKVPHHGSPRQVPAFFAAVQARAALVSVGAGNGYGHPAPSTLSLLNRMGARVYRTDKSGDVAIVDQEGALAVVSRGR